MTAAGRMLFLRVEQALPRYAGLSQDEFVEMINRPLSTIRIPLGEVRCDRFVKDWAPEIEDALLHEDIEFRRRWEVRVNSILPRMETLDYRSITVQVMIAELRAKGCLRVRQLPVDPSDLSVLVEFSVEEQMAMTTTRPGSRAEEMFGAGVVITMEDVWPIFRVPDADEVSNG